MNILQWYSGTDLKEHVAYQMTLQGFFNSCVNFAEAWNLEARSLHQHEQTDKYKNATVVKDDCLSLLSYDFLG